MHRNRGRDQDGIPKKFNRVTTSRGGGQASGKTRQGYHFQRRGIERTLSK